MKKQSAIILSLVAALSLNACSGLKKKSNDAPSTATTAPAKAKESKPSTTPGLTVCKKGKEERKLEVVNQASGCELHYTKGSKTEVVATSVKGNEHCTSVSQRMQKKLTAAGYRCQ